MHPLLERQLRKVGLDGGTGASSTQLAALIDAVSRSYRDVDQERYLLERSQDLASREMVELNSALRLSEARMASLLSLSSDWVWEQDLRGRFTFVSDELLLRTGIQPERLLGRSFATDGPLRMEAADLAAVAEAVNERTSFHHVTVEVQGDNDSRYMRISGAPAFEGGTCVGYRGVGSDVTERVHAERTILELARYDTLTGLPNRAMFLDEMTRALAGARRTDREVALLFIDLDRFKHVNDTVGHAAGDAVLAAIATRFRSLVGDTGVLARLGGDEFVVIIDVAGDTRRLDSLAQQIIDAASEPVQFETHRLAVSASVGLAVYPHDGADAHALLRSADTAMYHAKAQGRETFAFFTGELAERSSRQFEIEEDLRIAVRDQHWVLLWQPQVDAESGRWASVEGLIRWQHPHLGLVPPSDFIDIAEEAGLTVPMGRWVIGEACRQYAHWRDDGIVLDHCAVNISLRQLESDSIVDDIAAALDAYGMAPRQLALEVTEALVLRDPARALAVLDRLHQLGVRLVVDDFGTGYSSLGQLKRIPAQTLKLDRIFVSGLPDSADDLAIARAVVAMGQSLGMCVVAEGVENELQRRCLERLGVDHFQGYLFARPMPGDQLTERIRNLSRSPEFTCDSPIG